MPCGCPTVVLANVDALPPGGGAVQESDGACLNDAGDYLYGIVSSGGRLIVRWPFPGVGSVETVMSAGDFPVYPCVLDGLCYFMNGSADIYSIPAEPPGGGTPPGSKVTLTTLPEPVNGWTYWGLHHYGGYLWIAFYHVVSTGPNVVSSGVIRVTPGTGAQTTFEFSNGLESTAVKHLDTTSYGTVADDGAVWFGWYTLVPSERGLARLDCDAGTWTNTDGTMQLQYAHCVGDAGKVRTRDENDGTGYLISPDLSTEADPCAAGAYDDTVLAEAMHSRNLDWTVIAFGNWDNELCSVACTHGALPRPLRIKQVLDYRFNSRVGKGGVW
jgi:hypothetical protein